jgi:UDP-N-acetylglucosamine acyltransferase
MERNDISDFAFVSPNAILGKGNVIMEGVIIRDGVIIGDNNFIGPQCIIGDSAEKRGYFDKPGKVVIGNNNRFTKQVTIDAGTERCTEIKSNVIMLKNAHVGHDAIIGKGVTLSCNSAIGGFSEIGDGSNFGLGAVCHQRTIVPEGCMIGMNTTITKQTQLAPFKKYVGSPAREIGDNVKPVAGDPNCYC